MTLLDTPLHPLLTPELLTSLSQRKIFTIVHFVSEPVEKLITITKLSFKNILKIKTALLNQFAPPLVQGTDLAIQNRQHSTPVSSGIPGLDAILQGGFFSGYIYEVCGPAGQGKTQLCHTVAAHVRHPVFYIDSKGDFSAKRICQINNQDFQETLLRVSVTDVYSLLHVITVLCDLVSTFKSSPHQETTIIILDSVPTHFYGLLDTGNNCQAYLSQIGNLLKYLAHRHGCIVLATNLLSLSTEPHEAHRVGMGKYWSHVPHVRVSMTEGDPLAQDYKVSIMQTNRRKLTVKHTETVNISLKGVH